MPKKLSCTPEKLIAECYNWPFAPQSLTLRFGQHIANKYGIPGELPFPELFFEPDIYKAFYIALKNIIEN